jgi:hypothetical protein
VFLAHRQCERVRLSVFGLSTVAVVDVLQPNALRHAFEFTLSLPLRQTEIPSQNHVI